MSGVNDPLAAALTRCFCCAGVQRATPEERLIRAGLSSFAYRVGTHPSFLSSMQAGISTTETLAQLTTRRSDDFSLALIDSWAVVLDVLSFYQERLANEGFLRTGEERRSMVELARLIGYELRPGVSSSTYLAFTLDGSEGSPEEITLPVGTRAQSTPGQDELPQTFETSDEFVARPEWSAFAPRLTYPQAFSSASRVFYLGGLATGLELGDRMLLVLSPTELVPLTVRAVEEDADQDRTKVTLEEKDGVPPPPLPPLYSGIGGAGNVHDPSRPDDGGERQLEPRAGQLELLLTHGVHGSPELVCGPADPARHRQLTAGVGGGNLI